MTLSSSCKIFGKCQSEVTPIPYRRIYMYDMKRIFCVIIFFVPYVRVDGDVIQIAGKEEVKVMFNGRMKNICL